MRKSKNTKKVHIHSIWIVITICVALFFVAFADTNEMIEKARYYLKNPEARSAVAEAGKTTALGFRQEDMFKLLSTSIHRCKTVKRHVAASFSYWSGGIMRNSIIETVDLAAKIKRGVMQKVIKH